MTPEERLSNIQSRIREACKVAGRSESDVCLIAVSKNQSIAAIRELYRLGLRHFGESRLQEAEPKLAQLPADICWHYIGTLQSNKAKKVAQLFDVIHTLCKESQLVEIAKIERSIDCLIEVNIGEESQKDGLMAKNLDDFACKAIQYSQVRLQGLMTIGPLVHDSEQMRPYFKEVARLNREVGGKWLSMGMSSDFEIAIQEGSTHVRIGTALFGERS